MLAPREEDRAIDTFKDPLRPITLVLGGAASGKSIFAESLIETGFGSRWTGATYLATATADDGEMAAKIERHRNRRGEQWDTVEAPLELAKAMARHANADRPVLVDCLTLWLSNSMMADRDIAAETRQLNDVLDGLAGPVVLVSNEVGSGIVPENALARRFRDESGRLNQAVAAAADRIYLVVAGLPQILKDNKA